MKVDLLVWTERLPASFRWDPSNPVRGTEQFYVETARYAAKTGLRVVVAMDRTDYQVVDGVDYAPRQAVSEVVADRVLVCNWTGERVPRGRCVVHWTNFADFTPSKTHPLAERVILISDYARRRAGYLAGESSVAVIGHGVDRGVYYPPPDGTTPRKRQCVYSSSMDRGGFWLRDRWPEIEEQTGFRLVTTAYPGTGNNNRSPMSREDVANLLRESAFWLHPGLGIELFCLSAAEAQACGCVPIYASVGALPETCAYGHAFPPDSYLDGLKTTLTAPWHGVRPSARGDHLMTWSEASSAILACFTHI